MAIIYVHVGDNAVTINSKVAGSAVGDTISFDLGTYTVPYNVLNFIFGRIYTGNGSTIKSSASFVSGDFLVQFVGSLNITEITGFVFESAPIRLYQPFTENGIFKVHDNTFQNSTSGIYLEKCNLSLFNNNTFSNLQGFGIWGNPGNGNTYSNNSFDHVYQPILLIGPITAGSVKNTIINCNVITNATNNGIELRHNFVDIRIYSNWMSDWLANGTSNSHIAIACNIGPTAPPYTPESLDIFIHQNVLIQNGYSGNNPAILAEGIVPSIYGNYAYGWSQFILNGTQSANKTPTDGAGRADPITGNVIEFVNPITDVVSLVDNKNILGAHFLKTTTPESFPGPGCLASGNIVVGGGIFYSNNANPWTASPVYTSPSGNHVTTDVILYPWPTLPLTAPYNNSGQCGPSVVPATTTATSSFTAPSTVPYWFRVVGQCLPSLDIQNSTIDPTDAEQCLSSGGISQGRTILFNVLGTDPADICVKLQNSFNPVYPIIWPVKTIHQWSRPAYSSDQQAGVDYSTNTLIPMEFESLSECANLVISQANHIQMGMNVTIQLFTGGFIAYGSAVTRTSAFAGNPDISLVYIGCSVQLISMTIVSSPILASYSSLINDYGTVSTSCGCLALPLLLGLNHNIVQNNSLSDFMTANGYSIPSTIILKYNKNNGSWRNNYHFDGIGLSGAEAWDLMFEWSCTNFIGGDTYDYQWKMSIFARRKQGNREHITRLLCTFSTDPSCSNSNFSFQFTVDTVQKLAVPPSGYASYIFVLNDEIGIFNNPYWLSNSILNLGIVEVSNISNSNKVSLSPILS